MTNVEDACKDGQIMPLQLPLANRQMKNTILPKSNHHHLCVFVGGILFVDFRTREFSQSPRHFRLQRSDFMRSQRRSFSVERLRDSLAQHPAVARCVPGWQVGAGWLGRVVVSCLLGWLVGWLVCWLLGCLVCWLLGCLLACLVGGWLGG